MELARTSVSQTLGPTNDNRKLLSNSRCACSRRKMRDQPARRHVMSSVRPKGSRCFTISRVVRGLRHDAGTRLRRGAPARTHRQWRVVRPGPTRRRPLGHSRVDAHHCSQTLAQYEREGLYSVLGIEHDLRSLKLHVVPSCRSVDMILRISMWYKEVIDFLLRFL